MAKRRNKKKKTKNGRPSHGYLDSLYAEARMQNPDAMFTLGLKLIRGEGVRQNKERGFALIKGAADLQQGDAIYYAGLCYAVGRGTPMDLEAAKQMLRRRSAFDLRCRNALQQIEGYHGEGSPIFLQEDLEEKAREGDQDACYRLAETYLAGVDLPQDDQKAYDYFIMGGYTPGGAAKHIGDFYSLQKHVYDFQKASVWYQRALQSGDNEALFAMGDMYLADPSADHKEGIRLVEQAAEAGHGMAARVLSNHYFWGIDVKQDDALAFHYAEQALALGEESACYELGLCYFEGRGVPRDRIKGRLYVQQAAQQGETDAILNMPRLLVREGTEKHSYDEVCAWVDKAKQLNEKEGVKLQKMVNLAYDQLQITRENADITSLTDLTLLLEEDIEHQDFTHAEEIAYRMLELEDEEAPFTLAEAYKEAGRIEKHIEWLELACEKGQVEALVDMAYYLTHGQYVKRNYAKARRYYEAAAEYDETTALYNLAIMCLEGQGGSRSMKKALSYLRRGAELDDVDAMYLMAEVYAHYMRPSYLNDLRATHWYKIAAEHGHPDAIALLKGAEIKEPVKRQTANIMKSFLRNAEDYEEREDIIKTITDQALDGDPESALLLGQMYLNGLYVEADPEHGFQYVMEAVFDGLTEAKRQAGICYEQGLGVPQNYERAADFYEQAAREGDGDAAFRLDMMKRDGLI